MNANLVQQAVLGSPDAWPLLLSVGAERVAAAAKYQPVQTELTKDDFCKKDARETLAKDEVAAALRPAELVSSDRYASYVVNASRLNKRLPNSFVVKFLKIFKPRALLQKSSYEAIAAFCGDVGGWLCGFDAFQHDPDIFLPSLFRTLRLAPEDAEEAELKLWDRGCLYCRLAALRALRRRNPDKARELLAAALPQEKDAAKIKLVDSLAVGLSAKDEPFLEELVAGKGRDLRGAAFRLLCKIPTSQRSLTMQERAEAVLRGEVPEYDADCKLAQFANDEYSLAVDIVQSIPLRYWTEKRQLSPAKLRQKHPCSPETEPVYIGWLNAFTLDVYHYDLESELDAPQEIVRSTPRADEWIGVFVAFWNYLTGITTYAQMKEQRVRPIAYALVNLKELLCRFGGDVAFQMNDLAVKNILFTSFNRGIYYRDYAKFEPKPWSEEFMNSYFQHIVENQTPGFETAIVYDLGFFSPKLREKIVQLTKERSELQRQSGWYDPVTMKEIWYNPALPEELYTAVEDYVACFGEITD